MSFWRPCSLFSSTTPSTTTNNNNTIAQETIESLCDRLQSTIRIEDRRNILRALRGLSKKYKLEVGTRSMVLLGNILQDEKTDLKLIQLALDTLLNLTADDTSNDEEQLVVSRDITAQLIELFIKNKEHVHAILEFILTTDLNVRRAAIRFLTALFSNCTEQLQDILLESDRTGFSKLFDLLENECAVIQNNALPLFELLTRSNRYLQNIVVSENGFERLFRILVHENSSDGDVAVGDCLCVLLNLLENNEGNRIYFHNRSYIERIFDFFGPNLIREKRWSVRRLTNVHLLLEITRIFVLPTNSPKHIVACQTTIERCGILWRLCIMLTLTTIPVDILAETIHTIGDVVRGNAKNQQYLGSVMNKNTKVQEPVLFNRLYAMVIDKKQSFSLRISILYCLQCYLYKNESGKSMIVQTLLPQTKNAVTQYTLDHSLIIGYLSKDIIPSWCSGIGLAHLIAHSQKSKEDILEAKLAVDQAKTNAKTLMEISIDLLHNSSSSFHIRVAVLIFICSWLSNCSSAVQELVSIENSISYLVSQICAQSIEDDHELLIQSLCSFALGLCLVFNNNQIPSYSSESIKQIINERIGIDLFEEKLQILSKNEYYVKALQKPQLKLSASNDMILDYEFAHLYKNLKSSIRRMLTAEHIDSTDKTHIDPISTNVNEQLSSTMMIHNDLIRQKIEQMNIYTRKEKQLIQERDTHKTKIVDLDQQIQEIKDKIAFLDVSSGQALGFHNAKKNMATTTK